MIAPALMLAAWGIEVAIGWPDRLYRLIRHPVVWLGALISMFDCWLNQPGWPYSVRYACGVFTTAVIVGGAGGGALLATCLLPETHWGFVIEALIASSVIASRSLYAHVAAVVRPLLQDDLEGARSAVAMIVGRDPQNLDAAGVSRAALESLAENASDGVVAPILWGVLFGLPGIAAYKAVNTLDSMLGHRTETYAAFGGFAARLDDAANLVPARLTGLCFAIAGFSGAALAVMRRDAQFHRSLNAGWPEGAMAGALGVRLSGPRRYGDDVREEPWLNGDARDPVAGDVARGLNLYVRAMSVFAIALLSVMLVGAQR